MLANVKKKKANKLKIVLKKKSQSEWVSSPETAFNQHLQQVPASPQLSSKLTHLHTIPSQHSSEPPVHQPSTITLPCTTPSLQTKALQKAPLDHKVINEQNTQRCEAEKCNIGRDFSITKTSKVAPKKNKSSIGRDVPRKDENDASLTADKICEGPSRTYLKQHKNLANTQNEAFLNSKQSQIIPHLHEEERKGEGKCAVTREETAVTREELPEGLVEELAKLRFKQDAKRNPSELIQEGVLASAPQLHDCSHKKTQEITTGAPPHSKTLSIPENSKHQERDLLHTNSHPTTNPLHPTKHPLLPPQQAPKLSPAMESSVSSLLLPQSLLSDSILYSSIQTASISAQELPTSAIPSAKPQQPLQSVSSSSNQLSTKHDLQQKIADLHLMHQPTVLQKKPQQPHQSSKPQSQLPQQQQPQSQQPQQQQPQSQQPQQQQPTKLQHQPTKQQAKQTSEKKAFSFLSTPLISIGNRQEANSEHLAAYVLPQDCCLIRGLCRVLDLRLEIFSTTSLRKQNGDCSMEIRVQPRRGLARPQTSCKLPLQRGKEARSEKAGEESAGHDDDAAAKDFVVNNHCSTTNTHTSSHTNTHTSSHTSTKTKNNAKSSWHFPSHPSSMTIDAYAQYQALSFVKAKSLLIEANSSKSQSVKEEHISFATNLDLSSPLHWHEQINEVNKLPDFLKVTCPHKNMLNHIGHSVLGVNTVQLYMKVPGCRTTGHQENNNFSAINVNIGPGSCEWFCVPKESWPAICRMCKKRGLNPDSSAWWPDVDDLRQADIPFYHLLQLPGDTVWVGPGTVHWVQALGWCNNIAWNVGSFTAYQYKSAMHRYHLNQQEPPYKSIVPMMQLSWNLLSFFLQEGQGGGGEEGVEAGRKQGGDVAGEQATLPFFTQEHKELLVAVMLVLQRDLRRMEAVVEECARLNRQIIHQNRLPTDIAHYCAVCLSEVFNILFASKNVVFCQQCALKRSPTLKDFYVLEEYELHRLRSRLQRFVTRLSPLL